MEEKPSPVPSLPALSAASLACHDFSASASRIRSKAEKGDVLPPAPLPVPSLGGCSDPGLVGSQTHPTLSAGSRIRNQDLRLPKRRSIPGKRHQCSGDGCRLAFRSAKELLEHLQVHYRPTQSLEGKTFLCSAVGCLASFPNMQKLLEHSKTHYKPNRYFKCENCLSRFRTHRSLFKHLHVCSEHSSPAVVAAAALMAERPGLPPAPEKDPPGKLPEGLPKLPSVIPPVKKEALPPAAGLTTEAASALGPDPLPAPAPSLEAPPLPLPAAHSYPLLEASFFGPPSAALARFSGPPPASVPAGPFLPFLHPCTFALPPPAGPNRLRPYLPAQGLPVSNAVWKKSQGHSSNSRIVWEHTRGRYNCLQCSYSTASREEMTQHIEDHRKNSSPPGRLEGEIDFGVGPHSFHPKLTQEMENYSFSPL
ncbi:zinc finger protein 414 isoform X2 [Hemicordylus capensis]|uniref:zinc finger protein 414 isoform X2 n=1 Tax=Hemicordylus capensis TaxID=884348 RepID=UPI002302E3C6|nr:zinc finger protein 414 isoform X2 [Hemicordylus capensis]